jgi:hypothetical protein
MTAFLRMVAGAAGVPAATGFAAAGAARRLGAAGSVVGLRAIDLLHSWRCLMQED